MRNSDGKTAFVAKASGLLWFIPHFEHSCMAFALLPIFRCDERAAFVFNCRFTPQTLSNLAFAAFWPFALFSPIYP